jgi:hypothetical protein
MPIKTSRFSKLQQDLEKLTEENRKLRDLVEKHLRPEGMDGASQQEAIPYFNKAADEEVKSHGNSWIVMGKDRDASLKSVSYGTNNAMIDLVAGRASSHRPKGNKYGSAPDKNIAVNPNFYNDAARIYISQRTSIDSHFGLAPAPKDRSVNRSGIGIKADCVRVIGRNSVKIVTGKGIAKGGKDGELNSIGGQIDGPGSISLIAGNYTEDSTAPLGKFFQKVGNTLTGRETREVKVLQPIPKGDNLVECLRDIVDLVNQVGALVGENSTEIKRLARIVALHFHDASGGVGLPTTPSSTVASRSIIPQLKSFKNLMDNFNKIYNELRIEANYLNEEGALYINSRHVRTT